MERHLETLPKPYSLGWKISQFRYEGEMKSKKNETKKGCVGGSSVMGLVVTNGMKKVKPSLEWRRGSGSLTQNSHSMSEMNLQLL